MWGMMLVGLVFFFFKQKTAYEMRISDWSSDVCSSDLLHALVGDAAPASHAHAVGALAHAAKGRVDPDDLGDPAATQCVHASPLRRERRPFRVVLVVGGPVGPVTQQCTLVRSEEHTSELKSLMRNSYPVLLLDI